MLQHLPYLKKSENPTQLILSPEQKIRMLEEKLVIAIAALSEYSNGSNWSTVKCWGNSRERRWRGQTAEQQGFDLARTALKEIGVPVLKTETRTQQE